MSKIHGLSLLVLACVVVTGSSRAQESSAPAPAISTTDPFSLQRAIDQAYQAGQPRIVIPPGVYSVAAAPRSGAHLHFAKMKSFEIDATGVTLIFTTRNKSSFDFDHCEGVTLRGATLLHQTLSFSQGTIVALSPDGLDADIQVSAGYPADVDDPRDYPRLSLNLYDATTRQWQDDDGPRKPLEKLSAATFRFHSGRPLGGKSAWQVGSAVAWRGAGAADIELNQCAAMKILDVTIKGGSGFCVHENGGAGGSYYRYAVTYSDKPPGASQEPLMASNADAFHSDAVRHGPTLEDCHFEGMNDDGIPIHGAYALVEESAGNQVTVEVRHAPFCEVGDHLRFQNELGVIAGEARVTAVDPLPAYHPSAPPPKDLRLFQDSSKASYERLTLDQPLGATFGWLAANADANGAGFVIRRCTVRNNRARGMLIKASDGLIENCTIDGSSMGGIVLSPEMDYWNESDYARHVVVRNNIIRHCNYWNQPGMTQTGAVTVDAFEKHQFVPLPGGHRNIVIEGNTFENDDGPNLVVSSAEGVIIRNNRFVHPMERATERGSKVGVNPAALLWLTQCSGVEISNNLLVDPGPCLQARIAATATVSGTGVQDGVSLAAPGP